MLAILLTGGRFLVQDIEHQRHAGAVDVGIHKAHFQATRCQTCREVGGDGALAHTSLSTGDGDNVFDMRQHLAQRSAFTAQRGHACHHGHVLAQHLLEVERDGLLHALAAMHGGIAHLHVHADGVAGDLDVAHQIEGHDVLLEVGFDDAGKGGEDGVLGEGHDGYLTAGRRVQS